LKPGKSEGYAWLGLSYMDSKKIKINFPKLLPDCLLYVFTQIIRNKKVRLTL